MQLEIWFLHVSGRGAGKSLLGFKSFIILFTNRTLWFYGHKICLKNICPPGKWLSSILIPTQILTREQKQKPLPRVPASIQIYIYIHTLWNKNIPMLAEQSGMHSGIFYSVVFVFIRKSSDHFDFMTHWWIVNHNLKNSIPVDSIFHVKRAG